MHRGALLGCAVFLTLSACSSDDPCANQGPDCVAVTVESQLTIDQLVFYVDQPRVESLAYPTTPNGPLEFPLRMALSFPAYVQGVQITVDGLSGGNFVGAATQNVPIPASGYADVTFTIAVPDLGFSGDMSPAADLAHNPDLACPESVLNCGGCGIVCSPPANASTATCKAGVCGLGICESGYADCDHLPGNGCEVYTNGDPLNCGGCGTICPSSAPACNPAGGGCTAATRVLVAAPEAFPTELDDVKNNLAGLGEFTVVDEVNLASSTPSLATLQQYDVVLVFSNNAGGYADATTFGNNLADYWDGGGRVVVAVFAQSVQPIGGRFGDLSNGYMLITPASYSQTGVALATVSEPTSPLMANVTQFTTSYRNLGAAVIGATVVASYDSGDPLIVRGVVKGRKRVDLNFLPPSNYWTGNGLRILRNALFYQ
jgi:hypothetical protein